MDWKKISNNYPAVFDKLLGLAIEGIDEYPDRKLYDFFDKVGIKITILYDGDWRAQYHCDAPIDDDLWFPTRRQAEEKAFERAFEILNKQLNEHAAANTTA